MNINETILLKIERYLNLEMNTQEKIVFEAEINNSDKLKEFIEIYQQIDDFGNEDNWTLYEGDSDKLKKASQLFLAKDVQDFSEKASSFQHEYHSNKNKKSKTWLRIAIGSGLAACLILILYGTFFQSNNLIDLYDDNKSWDELPSLTVKGGVEEKDKAEIEKLFMQKNYSETIFLCKKVMQDKGAAQPNLLLYLGVSQLELEQYQESLYSFSLLENSNAIDYHKAYWYKSLLFLKQDNKEKANIELQKIVANSSYFNHKKAKKLLNKIN